MGHELQPYTQETSYSCGSASLLIAYRKLGLHYNEPTLMLELGTKIESGTDLEAMYNHAMCHGFPAELKCWQNYPDLQKDIKHGVIIVAMTSDWGGDLGGHYAVVEDILPDYIELADPALQPEDWPNILSRKEFMAKWFADGYPKAYLLVKPKK